MTPHRVEIQVRFADTDQAGHVNNTAYATWSELARLRFLRESGHSVAQFILARLAIDYRRQVDFEDRVAVESRIGRIGTSSFVMTHAILAGDAVAAEVESVIVCFDYQAQRSVPIPGTLRAWLEDRR